MQLPDKDFIETPAVVTLNGGVLGVTQSGQSNHTVNLTTLSLDANNDLILGSDGGLYYNAPDILVNAGAYGVSRAAVLASDIFLTEANIADGTAIDPLTTIPVVKLADGTLAVQDCCFTSNEMCDPATGSPVIVATNINNGNTTYWTPQGTAWPGDPATLVSCLVNLRVNDGAVGVSRSIDPSVDILLHDENVDQPWRSPISNGVYGGDVDNCGVPIVKDSTGHLKGPPEHEADVVAATASSPSATLSPGDVSTVEINITSVNNSCRTMVCLDSLRFASIMIWDEGRARTLHGWRRDPTGGTNYTAGVDSQLQDWPVGIPAGIAKALRSEVTYSPGVIPIGSTLSIGYEAFIQSLNGDNSHTTFGVIGRRWSWTRSV